MVPALATYLTWFRAFNGPCLWACLAAAFLAGGAAAWTTDKILAGQVARADARLSRWQAEQADDRVAVVNQARDRQAAADAGQREREGRIERAIRSGFAAMLASDMEMRNVFETRLAGPEWDCLRRPLPAAVVDGLLQQANTGASAGH